MNPLIGQLDHPAFPELADALRSRINQIVINWNEVVRQAMPRINRLSFGDLTDSLQGILGGLADALASSDLDDSQNLVNAARLHGLLRFRLNFNVIEVMQEDRLLRATIVSEVEHGLARQMTRAEAAASHSVIDVMLEESLLVFVREMNTRLQEASQRELNYLAFLTHDLGNHLAAVSLNLQILKIKFSKHEELADAAKAAVAADRAIRDATDGMRRMLEHERLRKTSPSPKLSSVNLHSFGSDLILRFAGDTKAKGLVMLNQIPAESITTTDAGMIALVLHSVLGNAVKFSSQGTIRLSGNFSLGSQGTSWLLSVADNGRGIAPESVRRMSEAFRLGELHSHEGVGLGLAIAFQATKLLGADLAVHSVVDEGSTFTLTLPPVRSSE